MAGTEIEFRQLSVYDVGQLGERIRFVYVRAGKEFLRFLPEGRLHMRRHLLGLQLQARNIGQQEQDMPAY